MKNIFIVTLLFISMNTYSYSQDSIKHNAKYILPSVDVKTLDGTAFNTSQISNDGKPIIISFWAMWCTNCLKELKAINEEYSDWQTQTGVKLVAISVDDAKSMDKVKPFVNGKNWDYVVYLDPNKDFYHAMNITQIPHTIILNGKKEIVWQHVTYTEGSESELFEVVKKLASGQEISK